jgi:glycosidase
MLGKGVDMLDKFFIVLLFLPNAYASPMIERIGSQVRLNLPAAGTADQWVLRGDRGQICLTGTLGSKEHQLILDKVGYDESLTMQLTKSGLQARQESLGSVPRISPLGAVRENAVIYQLPLRTFFAQDLGPRSTGRFVYADERFFSDLRQFGVDYIWLTGVLEQASPKNSDSDVVKGDAGSYYALRDMWDVSSDLGNLREFDEFLDRAHQANIRVLVDLVANHTARSHQTDVLCKNDMNFGNADVSDYFFAAENNYYYIGNDAFTPPPGVGDGVYDRDPSTPGTQLEKPARVTGNDVISANPSISDWFETAKLNYGYHLQTRTLEINPQPRTWSQILDVAKYWLSRGVDGFRIDFAHVVPLEFWSWFSREIRRLNPDVFLVAEAYESAATMPFSYERLFEAGIDSVFHSELYWQLHDRALYPGGMRLANPLRMPAMRSDIVKHARSFTNYLENHDEIRIASKRFAPALDDHQARTELGFALSAYAALLPGHFLIHAGQELGEDASVFGAFAGDSSKTSIFDFVYQSFSRQWLQGRANAQMRSLRQKYQRLLNLKKLAPFRSAHNGKQYFDFDAANYRKTQSDWVAAYLRVDANARPYVVVINSHPSAQISTTLHFSDQDGIDPYGILEAAGISKDSSRFRFVEQLHQPGWVPSDPAIDGEGVPGDVLFRSGGVPSGLYLGALAPRSTYVFLVEAL